MEPNRLRREVIEVSAFLVLVAAYVGLRESIAGRWYFIIPIVSLAVLYAMTAVRANPSALKEFGIRTDNLMRATRITLSFFVPAAIVVIGTSAARGTLSPRWAFWAALALYPVWGTAQQFLFQSFLHTRLIKLGFVPWSALPVALVYAAVHPGSVRLAALTFLWGLIASFIFLKVPNIIPLGVAHGILGAMVYYLLFGQDVLANFG